MDYEAHYTRLIERARHRILEGYSERHHIIPRCMGGGNEPKNLVRLTASEHYVAHQLLVKMHPGNHRLVWALSAMTSGTKRMGRPPNKRYAWLRNLFAETMRNRHKGKPLSPEHRAKLSAAAKTRVRRPHSAEAKAKMSAAAKRHTRTPEHNAALARSKTGKKRGPHSEATKRKIAASNVEASKLRTHAEKRTPEYKARQSSKMKIIWEERRRAQKET